LIDRLVLLNDASVARGGATAIAIECARALRARDVPVTMIVGDNGDNPELVALGVEIVALDQQLLLDAGKAKAFARGLFNPSTKRIVGDWIARNDTPRTIYHVHTWTKILSPSLFAALHPVRSRLLISAHDFFLACPNGGYVFYRSGETCTLKPMSLACITADCDRRSYPQKLWRVARQASQTACLTFDDEGPCVLAVHDGMREGLERGGVPAGAIHVLRNPVRPFCSARVTAEMNREAVFIGRLHHEKGPDIAAEAALGAGIPLRIVGDGPMREAMQRDNPEIVFEGQRTHAEISALIARARVLIVSSRYPEPFGLVALEAARSGVPVVINRAAMLAPEIVARQAGIACDVKDPAGLARQLRALFDDDGETERLSRGAFDNTRDLAQDPDDWAEMLVRVYRSRAAPSPPCL
jgi:glycosyltransferase involved in cell wall biosynthesis